jgi:hypothetical protein
VSSIFWDVCRATRDLVPFMDSYDELVENVSHAGGSPNGPVLVGGALLASYRRGPWLPPVVDALFLISL